MGKILLNVLDVQRILVVDYQNYFSDIVCEIRLDCLEQNIRIFHVDGYDDRSRRSEDSPKRLVGGPV